MKRRTFLSTVAGVAAFCFAPLSLRRPKVSTGPKAGCPKVTITVQKGGHARVYGDYHDTAFEVYGRLMIGRKAKIGFVNAHPGAEILFEQDKDLPPLIGLG